MLFKKHLRFKVYFNDDSKYDLKDSDQQDWLKILGTSGDLIPKIRKKSDFSIAKESLYDMIVNRFYYQKPEKAKELKEKIEKYLPKFLYPVVFEYVLIPSQHINSQRLVYRYNIVEDCFEISKSYIYNDTVRTNPNPSSIIKIQRNEQGVYESPVIFIDKMRYFNLTPFFGGNEKAPITNSFLIKFV